MSKDELKAAISSNRRPTPPLQRGKGVQLSVDTQESDTAKTQPSKKASLQNSDTAERRESEYADTQNSDTAKQLQSISAETQERKRAELRNSEAAILHSSDLAEKLKSSTTKEQSKRINRGISLPEELFDEYKLYGVLLKRPMHYLMEDALRAYLPQIKAQVAERKM